MLADPAKRLVYQKLGAERKRPPNALLISNFLTPPTIDSVDLTGCEGSAGQVITVIATDAIDVVDVTLRIRDARGALIESGAATEDHGVWTYHTTVRTVTAAPYQVEATAANRAGAEVRQSYPKI